MKNKKTLMNPQKKRKTEEITSIISECIRPFVHEEKHIVVYKDGSLFAKIYPTRQERYDVNTNNFGNVVFIGNGCLKNIQIDWLVFNYETYLMPGKIETNWTLTSMIHNIFNVPTIFKPIRNDLYVQIELNKPLAKLFPLNEDSFNVSIKRDSWTPIIPNITKQGIEALIKLKIDDWKLYLMPGHIEIDELNAILLNLFDIDV